MILNINNKTCKVLKCITNTAFKYLCNSLYWRAPWRWRNRVEMWG